MPSMSRTKGKLYQRKPQKEKSVTFTMSINEVSHTLGSGKFLGQKSRIQKSSKSSISSSQKLNQIRQDVISNSETEEKFSSPVSSSHKAALSDKAVSKMLLVKKNRVKSRTEAELPRPRRFSSIMDVVRTCKTFIAKTRKEAAGCRKSYLSVFASY
jgi:hypothetical protein